MSAAGSTSSLFGAGAAAVCPGAVLRNDANAFVAPDAEGEMEGGVGLASGDECVPNVEEGLEEKKLEVEVVEPNPLKPPSFGTAGT